MTDTKYVLVVEDDPILKNLLGHSFTGPYQVIYAGDGNEALTMIDANRPVAVLLDLMLPTTDGFAVLEAIRAREDALKDIPVIIVSNLGQVTDKERAQKLGATDYMVKAEVSVEEIVARLQKTLHG